MISKLTLLIFFSIPSLAHSVDNDLFISILACESSGHSRNQRGKPLVGDGGLAKGIAQFHQNTFNELSKKAHMKNMHWLDPIDQMRLMVWAIDNGYGNRWSCYRKLTHTGEYRAQKNQPEMRNY
jgi:hypothetical protein